MKKMTSYILDSKGYVIGYEGYYDPDDIPEQPPEDLYDEWELPQYKLVDGKLKKSPQTPSAAMLEERRNAWTREQIFRVYPINEEQRITRENIAKLAAGEAATTEFSTYNAYIEAVKAESQRRKTNQDWSDYNPEETSG